MEVKEIKYADIEKANKSIKTTDIKGKDYAEVNQRIKAFIKKDAEITEQYDIPTRDN